ncbi:GNAT family N-acetyltransferase [Clostridium sp. LBM24168]
MENENMIDYGKILKDNIILESDRLLLRPFTLEDSEDVFLYASDDAVTKYLTWTSHKDIEESEKVLKEAFIDKPGIFAIELKLNHKCIGCIGLRFCAQHNKADVGYVLNRRCWNNGYMSEALNSLLEFSFLKLKLNRIEAEYYAGNEGSGKVMQKCGMKYEGTGLQEVKIKGIFYDVVHYAILKDDWMQMNS